MAKTRALQVQFPVKGLSKRHGYQGQAPFTTVDCLNVWPTDWTTGRERGGTRPGLTSFRPLTAGGTKHDWCEVSFTGTGDNVHIGVAVATNIGVSVSVDGGSFEKEIDGNSSSSTCTMYQQTLYHARAGKPLVGEAAYTGGNPSLPAVGTLSVDNYVWTQTDFDNGNPPAGTEVGVTTNPDTPKGIVPQNCGLIQSWGDRLVLSGDTQNPHIVYMSRVGDAHDWDYSSFDQGAAWANSGGSAGKISEPITSLIPHNSQCLLIGCTDSLYAVRGNPRLGGGEKTYMLSHKVGPLTQTAWCKTGADYTVMMTRDGLYQMRPGCGEPPTPMSREVLPADLVGMNPESGDTISLGYDTQWKGIHIYVKVSGERKYYFYDMQSGGYWPMDFGGTKPQMAVEYKQISSETKSGLLAVTSTNTLQFDKNKKNNVESCLYYGPLPTGSAFTEAIVDEVSFVLGSTSGEVHWALYSGDTPEEAFNSDDPWVGTIQDIKGLNYTETPLRRGSTCYIKVWSDTDAWSVEEILVTARAAGRRRVG